VLDAGGVLVAPAPVPALIRDLAGPGERAEALVGRFRRELRRPLWSGAAPEAALWRWLREAGVADASDGALRARLVAGLRPLPALGRVADWRRRVPVAVLSNHRSEWLLPVLARAGLGPEDARILVSDRIGALKPDAAAWDALLAPGIDPGDVLLVDDAPRNLRAAAARGMRTLPAGPDGAWIREVDRALG
jgi:putative hydrolase of the HAD superfamily